MRSLRWKLGGAFILIVVVLVGLMALLTNWNTSREFSRYIEVSNTLYGQYLSNVLGNYYESAQSWEDIQDDLDNRFNLRAIRVIVSNQSGTIVGDSNGELLGNSVSRTGLTSGIAITASGETVGEFFMVSATDKMGMTPMGRRWNIPPEQIYNAEQQFISRSNAALWITGLAAAALALLIGLALTRQITKPVYALTRGAQQIADGKLDYRVEVQTKDELGGLAASFNKMAASLESGEDARRRFTADIAHELRTPLTIIEGTVNGIIDGVFEADQEHLDTVKEQTGMLTRLINDLRDLSLVEAGRLRLKLEATDILPLLERKINQIEVAAKTKNINLSLNAPGEMPLLNIDSGRIEQVIANLLSNAVRYTPERGEITVTVNTIESSSTPGNGEGKVSIAIADSGEGINPEHLEHIFDRFYRADDARTRREGGTGLGLAIVRHIVQAHGGSVRAESAPGQGSTFYVILPTGDTP